MDPTLAATVIADMEAPEASMVVAAMDPDDRVDVLEHVPEPLHDAIVGEMDAARRPRSAASSSTRRTPPAAS